MNKINIGGYSRISKSKARKLFVNEEKFYIFPCKVSPLNHWGLGMDVECGLWGVGKEFDKFVNEYEYYNCNNELGKYSAFYVKSE